MSMNLCNILANASAANEDHSGQKRIINIVDYKHKNDDGDKGWQGDNPSMCVHIFLIKKKKKFPHFTNIYLLPMMVLIKQAGYSFVFSEFETLTRQPVLGHRMSCLALAPAELITRSVKFWTPVWSIPAVDVNENCLRIGFKKISGRDVAVGDLSS